MYLTRRGKRRLLIVAGILVLAAIGLFLLDAARDLHRGRLVRESREAGLLAHSDGEYEEALRRLSYVLERQSDDLEALLAFADSRRHVLESGDQHLIKAIAYYNAALRVEPGNIEALGALLGLYRQVGYRAEAEESADRVLGQDPDHIAALEVKAEIAFIEERYDEAKEWCKRLSELEPQKFTWRRQHLVILAAGGETNEGLRKLCDRWIADHEQDGRFRLLKASVCARDNDYAQAVAELHEAVALGADSPDVLAEMLSMLVGFGLEDEAEALLERVRDDAPTEPWGYVSTVEHYWRLGRLGEARAELDRAREAIGSWEPEMLGWKALLHAISDERSAAEDALKMLLAEIADADADRRAADAAWARAIQARLDAGHARWSETVDAYRSAIALTRNEQVSGEARRAILMFFIAETCQQVGEYELALRELQRAGLVDPSWIAVPVARAEILLVLGRRGAAFKTISGIIRQRPDASIHEYLLLARAWLGLGEMGDQYRLTDLRTGREFALTDLLEQLHASWPDNPEVTALLVAALVQRGHREDAVLILEQAMADESPPARALILLAEVSGRWELGFEYELLARARQRVGLTGDVAAMLARTLCQEGRCEEGLALLDEMIRMSEESSRAAAEARDTRIELLLQANTEAALTEMKGWLREEPRSSRAASFVLTQEATWSDPELIAAAIESLKATLGSDATQVMLAEATRLYRFHRDDEPSIARALSLVEHVLLRTPDSKHALTLQATILMAGEPPRTEEAINCLRHAIAVDPSDLRLYPRLIMLLQEQGDYGSADHFIDQLTMYHTRDPDLRRLEIRLLKAQGDFGRAITRLSEIVDENSPEEAQLELASLHRKVGQFDGAEAIYTRLVNRGQCSSAALEAAADFYGATGRFERGLDVLRSTSGADEERATNLRLAAYCRRYRRLDDAAAHLQRAREGGDEDGAYWLESAYLHMVRNELPEALDDLSRGLREDPDNAEIRTALSIVGLSIGQTDREQALTILREAGAADDALLATLRVYERLVAAAEAGGPADEDLKAARELIRDHPQYKPAWRLVIMMHDEAGRADDAIRLAHQAMGRLPADPMPAQLATELLMRADRVEDARETARIWRHRSRGLPLEPDQALASIEMELGRPERAVRQLEPYQDLFVREADRDPGRLMILVRALLADGRATRAFELVTPLLGTNPELRRLLTGLAPDVAKEIGRQILAFVDPYYRSAPPHARVELASVWVRFGNRFEEATAFDRAAELLDSVEADEGLQLPVAILRGAVAAGQGDLATAERRYRAALAQDPEHIIALNNLADVLVRAGRRCDEAATLATRALALMPGDPFLIDTLAQALICGGHSEQAEQHLRDALTETPENVVLRVALGHALYLQDRLDEARRELDAACRALDAAAHPAASTIRRMERLEHLLAGGTTTDGTRSGGTRPE